MRITFLMPGYMWGPSGGYRVVYEYANQLVARGHRVSVVHPRRLNSASAGKSTLRGHARKLRLMLRELFSTPTIDWHPVDDRVRLLYVPSLRNRHVPDADVLFATAWNTARPATECSSSKGAKCYLIQHYETWMGPKNLVDDTWLMPLNKVVIAQWLLDLGISLGARSMTYIPNGMDHQRYRVIQSIESRPQQIVMMCSHVGFKGSRDGIAALEIVKKHFPNLKVVLFGNSYRPSWVPGWMAYHEDPPQQHIIEQLYNGSSIMVSPSLAEGFPLPPAEAAACGCALVATDIGGHREYIQNGSTGLLSPVSDPRALADNIASLLRDDHLRIRLAQAANTGIKQFTWQRSADLMESFLLQVAAQKSVMAAPSSTLEVSPA